MLVAKEGGKEINDHLRSARELLERARAHQNMADAVRQSVRSAPEDLE